MTEAPTQVLERETKFEAPLGLPLPDLRDLVGRTERLPERRLRTAYFDTLDQRLWGRGLTLRHRLEDEAHPGTWTLKLPNDGSSGPRLDRTELSWPGPRDDVPAAARDLLRGLVRREPLRLLVELAAVRQRLALHDHDDRVVAEIDDDSVLVIGGPQDGLRFRQVELEAYEGGDAVTRDVTRRLESAGAHVGGAAKFAMALGLDEVETRRPSPGREASLSDVVRMSIRDALDRLLDHDWRLRLELPDARPHDVHQARVATRRLRSQLKTLRSVLDPVWVQHIRSDLGTLASALGDVRDADVLAAELDGAPAELVLLLRRQRTEAARRVSAALETETYLDLLDRLHAATRTPPFLTLSGASRGDENAAARLPRLVGANWRSLRRQVRRAGEQPSDSELHRIRIEAKQLRYAAEMASGHRQAGSPHRGSGRGPPDHSRRAPRRSGGDVVVARRRGRHHVDVGCPDLQLGRVRRRTYRRA